MKKTFIKCYLPIIFLASFSRCLGQTPDSIVLKHEGGTNEKLFIHYDRSSYALGDTVWFKAYLFKGELNQKVKIFILNYLMSKVNS